MWNIRKSERDYRLGGKLSGEKLERKKIHERLLTVVNKGLQMGGRWEGWGDWVMGIKECTAEMRIGYYTVCWQIEFK